MNKTNKYIAQVIISAITARRAVLCGKLFKINNNVIIENESLTNLYMAKFQFRPSDIKFD